DDLTRGGLNRFAVERFDAPLQQRCPSAAVTLAFRPHRIGRGKDVDRSGDARSEDAVIDPYSDLGHGLSDFAREGAILPPGGIAGNRVDPKLNRARKAP